MLCILHTKRRHARTHASILLIVINKTILSLFFFFSFSFSLVFCTQHSFHSSSINSKFKCTLKFHIYSVFFIYGTRLDPIIMNNARPSLGFKMCRT